MPESNPCTGVHVHVYVQIEYVCGDDIVAMDYGSDIRGQHGEETAYLRIREMSQGPEWDLTS